MSRARFARTTVFNRSAAVVAKDVHGLKTGNPWYGTRKTMPPHRRGLRSGGAKQCHRTGGACAAAAQNNATVAEGPP
jgi:hypothetical protein